ncbi:MAG: hypothetical protein AAGK97_17440, partial [Bacteroidota bacterium]
PILLVFNYENEDWLKPTSIDQDEYFTYDIALKHTEKDLEIRCIIKPEKKRAGAHSFPQLVAMKHALSAANNAPENEFTIQAIDELELKESYLANWGVSIDFVPKTSLTSLPKGRLVSLMGEDKAMVFIFLFYNEETDLPETWPLLKFEP